MKRTVLIALVFSIFLMGCSGHRIVLNGADVTEFSKELKEKNKRDAFWSKAIIAGIVVIVIVLSLEHNNDYHEYHRPVPEEE